MNSFLQDVRYSLRLIAKAPGFAAIAILTLALGIGANTTIFSWINAALLNPVPGLTSASEVVSLTLSKPGENPFPFTYPDIEAIRDGQQSFTGIAACGFVQLSLTGNSRPERISGMVASANYFDVLGVRPILGRGFLPAEDEKPGGAPVAVISYRLWQTHFGANPNIVGETIEINQHPYVIVGVTPAVFQGSQTGVRTEIWAPIMMEAQLNSLGDLLHDHHQFWLLAFGRVKPRVVLGQAQEEMTLRLKREAKNYPDEHKGHDSVTVYPLWRNPFGLNFFLATLLPMLMCIAGLVLLLACVNVSNLMLVRAALLTAVLTGIIFGILPALRSSGVAPASVLKEDTGKASGGLGKARLASGLVVAQISLSLLLLICAGLFIRSFQSAQQINPGFNPHNVLIASYDLFTAGYSDATGAEFDRQLVAKLEALPGMQSVALTNRVPLAFGGGSTSVKPEGYISQANESMETQSAIIPPNYFQTIHIPIVTVRASTLHNTNSSQHLVIVSEAFVELAESGT